MLHDLQALPSDRPVMILSVPGHYQGAYIWRTSLKEALALYAPDKTGRVWFLSRFTMRLTPYVSLVSQNGSWQWRQPHDIFLLPEGGTLYPNWRAVVQIEPHRLTLREIPSGYRWLTFEKGRWKEVSEDARLGKKDHLVYVGIGRERKDAQHRLSHACGAYHFGTVGHALALAPDSGVDSAEQNGGDADPTLAHLLRQDTSEHQPTRFGTAVGAKPSKCPCPSDRKDVDNLSLPLFQHCGKDEPCGEVHALEVDLHGLPPRLGVALFDKPRRSNGACVINKDINAPFNGERLLNCLTHGGFIGDIGRMPVSFPPVLGNPLSGRLQLLPCAGDQEGNRALLSQQFGNLRTDPASTARN